jgi:hypothetical protein
MVDMPEELTEILPGRGMTLRSSAAGRRFNRLNALANFSRRRGRGTVMPVENRPISSNVA